MKKTKRYMIGAVVGVQPFGGEGPSGTGPTMNTAAAMPRCWRPGDGIAIAFWICRLTYPSCDKISANSRNPIASTSALMG